MQNSLKPPFLRGVGGDQSGFLQEVYFDACQKLQQWVDDRWQDFGCIDISKELAEIIDESWAREQLIPPYHIYLKIADHLSREAIEILHFICNAIMHLIIWL